MNNSKKLVPALLLALGVTTSSVSAIPVHVETANSSMFQIQEVSSQGSALAKGDLEHISCKKGDHKCGKDMGEHKCGKDMGEHKCGKDMDEHKCGKDMACGKNMDESKGNTEMTCGKDTN